MVGLLIYVYYTDIILNRDISVPLGCHESSQAFRHDEAKTAVLLTSAECSTHLTDIVNVGLYRILYRKDAGPKSIFINKHKFI